jgi:hypothetical protein
MDVSFCGGNPISFSENGKKIQKMGKKIQKMGKKIQKMAKKFRKWDRSSLFTRCY